MSYILDALKKDQANAKTGVGVNVNPSAPPPRRQTWLVVLSLALLGNLGVFSWYLWVQGDAQTSTEGVAAGEQRPTAVSQQNRDMPPPAATSAQPSATEIAVPAAQDASGTNKVAAREQATRPVEPTALTDRAVEKVEPSAGSGGSQRQPVNPQRPAAAGNTVAAAQTPVVPLSDLPAAQRQVFATLRYTSHIYTRDPSLRAIVINGQQLQAGDAINELVVDEITETGVVFEQTVQGQRRRVAVNPFE